MALEGTGILIGLAIFAVLFFVIFISLFIGGVGLLGNYRPLVVR